MPAFLSLLRAAVAGLCVAALTAAAAAAQPPSDRQRQVAQQYGAPPADVGGDDYGQGQDSSSLLVRIDRLENALRQLNGEVERLQFQNRKLEDALKKFEQDVDFRFQDGGRAGAAPAAAPVRPQKRSEATIDSLAADEQGLSAAAGSATAPNVAARAAKRADAFDPASDPTAPGAPRPLGSAASAAPPPARTRAAEADAPSSETPLDLSGARWRRDRGDAGGDAGTGSAAGNAPVAALNTPGAVAPGAAPINPLKEEFDVAYGYYRQKEYETAEKSFAAFIQKNPKSRMTADATYYLGESFFQRNRPREAAEQYLKVSTQYAASPRAPEALLRLGQSLNALGAKEQACATFAEVGRKYPNASAGIKAGADREAKRAQC